MDPLRFFFGEPKGPSSVEDEHSKPGLGGQQGELQVPELTASARGLVGRLGYAARSASTLLGASGVVHEFSLLFEVGEECIALDVYPSVTEFEVLKTRAKAYDVMCKGVVLSGSDRIPKRARALCGEYGMGLISLEDVLRFHPGDDLANALFIKGG